MSVADIYIYMLMKTEYAVIFNLNTFRQVFLYIYINIKET